MIWLLSQHLVVSGLFAVIVAVVCKTVRLAPATRHTLWLMVLIKVLLPLPVAWPWTVPLPSQWYAAEIHAVSRVPPVDGPTTVIPNLSGAEAVSTTGESITPTAAPTTSRGDTEPSRGWLPDLGAIHYGRAALAVWFAASVGLIAVQLAGHVRFLRKTRERHPAPDWLVELAARSSERLGVSTPEVHVTDGSHSPYVYGVLRPKLIVPARLLEAVPRERWACVLAHELAHLKRRDHWVRWVELIAGGVWFWNPVYWIARRNLRANAELACDAWVVWALPDARRAYAETLIDVSELIARNAVPFAALGIGSRGIRIDFERRLTMILHENNAQRVSRGALAIALLLAMLALPGWSQQTRTSAVPVTTPNVAANGPAPSPEAPQAKTAAQDAMDERLRAPVSIEFENYHISKIAEFLADYVDVNIVVDQRVVKPAVNKYIPLTGTMWGMGPGARTHVTDGMMPASDRKAVKPSDLLDEWTKPLGLTYKMLPARIFISTAEQMEKDGVLLDTDMSKDIDPEHATKSLAEPIDWKNDAEHIATAANRLSQAIHIPITVDARIVSPPKEPTGAYAQPIPPPPALPEEPVVDDPDLDRQYTTDGMVRSIRLDNVAFGDALNALVVPLNLTYKSFGSFIWITSPAQMEKDEFADPPVPEDSETVAQKLQEPVSLEFDQYHISAIVEKIAHSVDVNIVLDQRAVPPPDEEHRLNRPYLMRKGDVYVPTGYVPYIRLNDVPLKDALKAILVPLGLTYKVNGSIIFISTPELIGSANAGE